MSLLAFALGGIFLTRPFFLLQTGNAAIVEDGVSYLTICCVCSFGHLRGRSRWSGCSSRPGAPSIR